MEGLLARFQLQPGEMLREQCCFDLDGRMAFTDGRIVLTNRRLLADDGQGGLFSRDITPATRLEVRLRHTVGRLELLENGRVVRHWSFTAAEAPGMHALRDAFVARAASEPAPQPEPADEPRGTAGVWRALGRLIAFARPHTGMAVVGGILSLAGTAAALVPPYLTMPLVDRVLIPKQLGEAVPFSLVWWYLGGLAIAAVIAWLLGWARAWTLAWVAERVAADLRNRTYAHMQSLSMEFFGGRRTGDLIARVGSDTDRINNFMSVHLIDFSSNVMLVLLTAGVLIWMNPLLAAVTLLPFPLVVWLIYAVRERLRRGFARASIAWSDMTSVLADTIPGIRVVKAFAQEDREIERFAQANDQVLRANDRVNVVWSFFGPLVALLSETGVIVVWAAGAWLVFGGSVTVGTLTAFLAYIARFYGRVESMIRMVPATQRAATSVQRIFDILDCVPQVAEPARPFDPGRVLGRIELCDVRFRYGNREVLHGIDLVVEPGEMIGLVGTSGSGKTTLANLVCRFHDVSGGRITVDGHDLRSLSTDAWRRNLGVVLQEPFLFFGTVAENIAYGCPTASRERIVAAARAAGAHEFILSLPGAYDARVGERGGGLSGGERQRISIARALLVDPAILILDEATSSVDAETEAVIQAAIDHLVAGRTTIAIAHRLSTLRRADRIVVLDAGRIVEIGTHDELLAGGGPYAMLHEAQARRIESPPPPAGPPALEPLLQTIAEGEE